uniref:NADH dehydrogenase [ubiquinone] 1 alpha subcomplex subunit 12 isoform X1 n=1 Tax=Ictidomys tridecemlineatus TaxID=43179 RepID=UPI000682CE03|nr:NADH dehydrogenase [ubiquinone] 1 alpha subcomplex subunit 12 isoform X1 [Ictidomys tridecemlineatus]
MELLQVLKRGLQQVSGHGGLRGYLRVFFRANDVRVGTLVGEDKYGNKYYEDNKQFFVMLLRFQEREGMKACVQPT